MSTSRCVIEKSAFIECHFCRISFNVPLWHLRSKETTGLYITYKAHHREISRFILITGRYHSLVRANLGIAVQSRATDHITLGCYRVNSPRVEAQYLVMQLFIYKNFWVLIVGFLVLLWIQLLNYTARFLKQLLKVSKLA